MRLGKPQIKRFPAGAELVFDRLLASSNATGSFWVIVLMLFMMSDIIGRSFFGYSIRGTPEMVRISVVGMFFLQTAYVLRRERHIRSTLVPNRLPPLGGAIIDILAYCVGLAFCILLVRSAWPIAWQMTLIGEYEGEGAIHVYVYHVRWLIVAAGILMGVQLVLNLFRTFKAVPGLLKGSG